MTYTYTVTSYSYNCQVCGTRSHGVPRMSEIPRCLACNIALCKSCYQNGFCPGHWTQVPPALQQSLAKLQRKVQRRKKTGLIGFIICIAGALGAFIGLGSEEIGAGMGVGFTLLLLGIILVVPAVSPVKRFRKKAVKFLARSGVQMPNQVRPVAGTVPPQQVSAPAQAGPAVGKKFCSYCGSSINIDAVFCEKCGRKLVNP